MNEPSLWFPITAAALHSLTALVWAILARSYCRCHGTQRPESSLLRLFQALGWLFAIHYGSKAVLDFGPPLDSLLHRALAPIGEVSIVLLLVVLRHLVPLGTLGGPRPSRTWLLVNYGLIPVGLLALGVSRTDPVDTFDLFLTAVTGLILWDLVRFARGGQRPVLMADLRFRGYLVLALLLFGGVVILGLTETEDCATQPVIWVVSHIFVGLAAATPFALRILGEVVRGLLVEGSRLLLAVALVVAIQHLGDLSPGPVLLVAVAVAMLLGPGTTRLAVWADRLVLRHDQHWRRQLQDAVRALSPEAGVEEVCRRAAAEVKRVLHVPEAGLLINRDGGLTAHGTLELEGVRPAWPRGAEADRLPQGAFDLLWLDEPVLQESLYQADVRWIAPVRGPRRSWGHLFVSTGLLGNAATHSRLEALEDFSRELALVLDAADLLARVRTAERELARSEKLAALGETAARIAHEIRNPVTAARSLAQMLADDPTSPQNAEHSALVVRELDRVETQVRSMLQYVGRECSRLGPLDLGELVAATLHDLETFCGQREVSIAPLDLQPGVVVAGDAERLRQVLVNLVCNACEALEGAAGAKELGIRLAADAETATLEVADSGPGIPEEIRARLFEPFVSSKIRGTGLGLAIARRIVEAHGGDILAEERTAGGMCFRVRLPRALDSEIENAGAEVIELPAPRQRRAG